MYLIGAVLALCQNIGTSLVAPLSRLFEALPYVISIASCLLTVVVIIYYVRLEIDKREDLDGIEAIESSFGHGDFRESGETTQTTLKEQDSLNLFLLISTIALAAIPKVTRTLFTTYVTRRYGVPFDEVCNETSYMFHTIRAHCLKAQTLWLMRTIMTILVFSLVLPSAVVTLSRKGYSQPSTMALMAGKASILLVCIGALMVRLAREIFFLTVGKLSNLLSESRFAR